MVVGPPRVHGDSRRVGPGVARRTKLRTALVIARSNRHTGPQLDAPTTPLRRVWRWTKLGLQVAGVALLCLVGVAVVDGWQAFGKAADGERAQRMQRSPQFGDTGFENPQALYNDVWGMLSGIFDASPNSTPLQTIPTLAGDATRFSTPPPTGLRVTWLGHSTMLVELDGVRVLTDPVWGERSSPLSWLGPRRWYAPPLRLEDLPPIDAVVISHDHYDHLDTPTILAMKDWDTLFIAPLGVGAHLAYWGVPEDRIVELDWWDRHTLGVLEIVCTPARHASGRTLFDKDATLWAGYALLGPRHRVFFSGDTGLFPALTDIGEQLGPFDLTMIEVGAYGRAWPDWHLGPEQAVRAHRMVRGDAMLPVHWGLFDLAYHGWTEPIERVRLAAGADGVPLLLPRPGQSVEPSRPPPWTPWWPELPWRTAAQDPIVATQMDPDTVP
jgi:L-ascorbate metabolism protein UlaG (beta-lactamase superfamily)